MPDWTKGGLRAALLSRGSHYLNAGGDTLPDELVQEAIEEYVNEDTWEWRKRDVTLALPEVIEDLGPIQQVVGPGGAVLTPEDGDELRDRYGTLDAGGSPVFYYRVDQEVHTYPVTSDEVTVYYFTKFCWVEGGELVQTAEQDGAEPIVPPEERDLILLLARARVNSLNGDADLVEAVRQEYATRLEQQRSEWDQVDELEYIEVTNPDWF